MADVGLSHYLLLASSLFVVGAVGFLMRRNALVLLMCVQLMLTASALALVAFNRFHPVDHTGQIFALFVMVVAGAKAAVGLAIVLALYRLCRSVRTDDVDTMKG